MKRRAIALVIVVGVIFFLVGCGPDVVPETKEGPAEPVRQQTMVDPPAQPEAIRPVDDQAVGTRWKGAEIVVTEKKEAGQQFKVEIPLGGELLVEGTPFKIKLLSFVPDFAMNAETIGTKSLDDVNPAAKIEVSEGETILFTGWSFRDFPEMHAFDDPRFTVALTRAVPVEEQ